MTAGDIFVTLVPIAVLLLALFLFLLSGRK